MKKFLLSLLVVGFSFAAEALPVFNPAEVCFLSRGIFCDEVSDSQCCTPFDHFSFRAGFYGDYVFDRNMGFTLFNGLNVKSDVKPFKLKTNAGIVVLNLYDWVDLFSTLGATRFELDTFDAIGMSMAVPGTRTHVEGQTHFSWSVGTKARLFCYNCFVLGVEGQYFRYHPNHITVVNGGTTTSSQEIDFKYHEWQIGTALAARISLFSPYVGVKYSRPIINIITNNGSRVRLHGEKKFGVAIGCSLIACEMASVTAEVRFGDEEALHVNGQVRF